MPGKFSRTATIQPRTPIRTVSVEPDTFTHEGGAGWSRDAKSELFLLAVTNMVGEQTFYESGNDRDSRFRSLIAQVASEDHEWVARFVPYLRDTMNLRSASIVMAAELVRANLAAGRTGNRAIIASALKRADEPAEMIAYWRLSGRSLPMPVKRGIADALDRLYNEKAALKYDGQAGFRMGDVLDIVHPKPKAEWQAALYKYLLDKRHKREDADASGLPLIASSLRYEAMPSDEFRAKFAEMDRSGFTWEWASSRYGALDATFWQAMIPEMGYMALLRNLRNFDETDVSAEAKASVAQKLADPEQVAKSRQLPLRFYSAWANARGLGWGLALEQAINLSLANIPVLSGKTLVLVDMSGSMNAPLSERSKINRDKAAAVFGSAIALRSESANLVAFGTGSQELHFHKGDSVLRTVDRFVPMGGTQTVEAILAHYRGHDRIVILTDEQAFAWGQSRSAFSSFGIGSESRVGLAQVAAIPVPIYTFNLAGYEAGHLPSGKNRYAFGGLTDQGFIAIPLLEHGGVSGWPF